MGARHGQAGAGASLSHLEFTTPVGAKEIFPVTNMGNLYGFLIEEPQDDPLYFLVIDGTSGAIVASYSAEGSVKFGRDAQPFAMHFLPQGMDFALSTSRTAIAAPTAGTTVHIWYASQIN